MKKINLCSLFALVSLLSLGVSTTAHAGVPEDLAALKTATAELKTVMTAITDEVTAKAKVSQLEAAITKYNQASTALDVSLAKLDRAKEADSTLYQSTSEARQANGQSLVDEQMRLLTTPPISVVVSAKLNALGH